MRRFALVVGLLCGLWALDPACAQPVTSTTTTARAPMPDTDGDGIPDAWERAHRLEGAPATAESLGNGYSNLENYLNELAGDGASIALSIAPSSVHPGEPCTVTWTAPAGQTSPTDWIGFYHVEDPNGAFDPNRWVYTNGTTVGSVQWTAPSVLGNYNARYLVNDTWTSVAVSQPLAVTAVPFSVTAAPSAVAVNGTITVTWAAPAGQTHTLDWVGLYRVSNTNAQFDPNRWIYTNGATSGSVQWTAPSVLGNYNARYLQNDTLTSLALSNTVTVTRH